MDGWHFAAYAFAVYLAIHTLLALMGAYEAKLRQEARQRSLLAPKTGPDTTKENPSG